MLLKKYTLAVLSLTYVFFIFSVFYYYFSHPKFLIQTDVISFLTGAKIVNDGRGSDLYNLETQEEYQNKVVYPDKKRVLPFRNFPVTAFIYQPLLKLDLKSSYVVVFFVNILLLVSFHRLFTTYFPVWENKYLIFVPILFYPSVSNLIVGQFSPIILLIFTAIYIAIKKEKDFLNGAFTSLLFLKPQFLLFAPFSFYKVKNKREYLVGAFLGFLVLFLTNLAIVRSVRPMADYLNFISLTENESYGSRPFQMNTFFGFMSSLGPAISRTVIYKLNIILYFVTTAFVFLNRKKISPDSIFVLGIFITIFFSVHALSHDLLIFLLPIYIFLTRTKFVLLPLFLWLTAAFLLFPTSIVATTAIFVSGVTIILKVVILKKA